MRQKTFRTTFGMVRAGSLVSPAVIAMDSVPPSIQDQKRSKRDGEDLTSERGRYEDGCEATDASHKRRIADEPILAADVAVVSVSAAVDHDAKYDEDLRSI